MRNSANFLSTLRDNLSVPSRGSGIQKDFGLLNPEDYWKFLTDVSGQPISTILKSSRIQKDFGLFNHEEYWKFLIDVSGQTIGPILRVQESKRILDSSTLRTSRNLLP